MSDEGKKEHELYEQRVASAQKWRELNVNPFGNGFRPEHTAAEILAKHRDAALDAAQAAPEVANKAKDQAAINAGRGALEPLVSAANKALETMGAAYTVAGRVVALNSFG